MKCYNCEGTNFSPVYRSEKLEGKGYIDCIDCGATFVYDPEDKKLHTPMEYGINPFDFEEIDELEADKIRAISSGDVLCILDEIEIDDLEEPEIVEETIEIPAEEEHECTGECGGECCKCNEETLDEIVEDVEKSQQAVIDQLNKKDFGEYLIINGDYGDKDMMVFTGTKEELNKYINTNKFHEVPKVYELKQLKVETEYKVL